MLSTIFQTETTALESQVAALQAQIAVHTERISSDIAPLSVSRLSRPEINYMANNQSLL
jgi:hypothetical protein